MLDLYELEQLAAFAELGTLSQVAQQFHISTPSISRSMQHLEECFGVSLFTRSKNRITLNPTGLTAAEHAKKLLQTAQQTIQQVQEFDAKQKTITVKSCAPAPLWDLLKKLSQSYPNMTIASTICQNEEVLRALEEGTCDFAILPFPVSVENGTVREFMQEHLSICVPPEHTLAQHAALRFEQLNGFNFLLRSELGFWDTLCRQQMPASKFLVQTDDAVFNELVNASSLPCFTTDYFSNQKEVYPNRIILPIKDKEANVTFYLISKNRDV